MVTIINSLKEKNEESLTISHNDGLTKHQSDLILLSCFTFIVSMMLSLISKFSISTFFINQVLDG